MYPSGFNSLPIELCELIVTYTQSRASISHISQTCKRNYNIFIPFLYSELELNQHTVSALSLSSLKKRAFPNAPHPASFVKELHLEFDDDVFNTGLKLYTGIGVFQRKVQLVLKNLVEKSGGRPPLKKLSIDARFVPFLRMVGPLDVGCFRNLVDLSLVCEFPENTFEKSLEVLSLFLNHNLTSLHLGIVECEQSSRAPPEPHQLAQLLKVIAKTSGNLTFLGLAIPLCEGEPDSINKVLKKMTFPSLRSLLVNGHGLDAYTELDFLPFLANHPFIESLQYFSSRPIPDDLVPNIKSFAGNMPECIRMLNSQRPIYDVNVYFDGSFYDFTNVNILRSFNLTCSSVNASCHIYNEFQDIFGFIRVCPQIIHLDIDIRSVQLLPLILQNADTLLLQRFPKLETLRLHSRDDSISFDTWVPTWLRAYGEDVAMSLTPTIRQVTIEKDGSKPGTQQKETFVFSVHPHEQGVGRVVRCLAVRRGVRLELDVNEVMGRVQQEQKRAAFKVAWIVYI